jgi:glucose/arabinose dehydrogenase
VGPEPIPGKVIKLTPAYPNINFEEVPIPRPETYRRHITDIKFVPESDQVAVSFQTGQIIVFSNRRSATTFDMLLDLGDMIYYRESSEVGLMGLAFDPNFAQNRYFYVKYTKPSSVEGTNSIVVSRFRKNPSSWSSDIRTERVFWDINLPGSQHHSGSPIFDDDGLMIVPIGDGINCCTGRTRPIPARDLSSLRGKILRVDARRSAAEENDFSGPLYQIPADNPFKDTRGARPEVRKADKILHCSQS